MTLQWACANSRCRKPGPRISPSAGMGWEGMEWLTRVWSYRGYKRGWGRYAWSPATLRLYYRNARTRIHSSTHWLHFVIPVLVLGPAIRAASIQTLDSGHRGVSGGRDWLPGWTGGGRDEGCAMADGYRREGVGG